MAAIMLSTVRFLGVTMVTKIITGEELIINYHHQIVVIAVAASCYGYWASRFCPTWI